MSRPATGMHVAVIGAGVFGAWAAHHLRVSGARVSLVDAYGAANPRSSSGDYSRILRCGYGPDDIYSRLAARSLQQWLELQRRVGDRVPIWRRCGVLWLAAAGDAYTAATRTTLERNGLPVEALTEGQLRARYPHIDARDLPGALLEPDGGVLAARRAVRALVSELERDGVRVVRGRVEPPGPGRVRRLRFDDGTGIEADRFVFACGAWLPSVFPALLAGRIRPTRQTVVYFGTRAGDRHGPAHTPAWIDFPAGIYGVPDIDDCGLKVGIDEHGPPIDPDSDDRVADANALTRARAWLARRFPAMQNAPIVEARVCPYENTSNGDFLIDRHPDHDNVWIVGGGSGHGFKHGPAVGEDTAQLVLTGTAVHPRFSLSSKSTAAERRVY